MIHDPSKFISWEERFLIKILEACKKNYNEIIKELKFFKGSFINNNTRLGFKRL